MTVEILPPLAPVLLRYMKSGEEPEDILETLIEAMADPTLDLTQIMQAEYTVIADHLVELCEVLRNPNDAAV